MPTPAQRSSPPPPAPVVPRVVLVGGRDVGARLELMRALRGAMDLRALGSGGAPRAEFLAEGFGYTPYLLSGRPNPIPDVLTLGQLVCIFRRLKPDIVQAFDTKPGIWGCLAARLAGVPIVIGVVTGLGSLYASDGWRTRAIRRAYQILQRLACSVSDVTIFQHQGDARQFVAAGIVAAPKAIVIPGSGVVTHRFDRERIPPSERVRVRTELGIRPDEIVVTMIARVIRSKGVLEFAAAARDVRLARPGVRFVLVGSTEEESVDRLTPIEVDQLRAAVTWPGPRRDVPAVLAASDIFALPTAYREGIPRALLEAASVGLPIVTTDSPGCNEVVEHDVNGLLVPVRDPEALREAIIRLVDHPHLRARFARRSRQRAVERFDLSIIVARTLSVYHRLLEGKGARPRSAPAGRHLSSIAKRVFDVTFSVAALALTWPLLVLGAAAVKLTSPGPALYRAKRAGLRGRPFGMFKLRTMRVGPAAPDRRITAAEDDRVTAVGRVLRTFHIDELPQFWNVLRGEMSVVGPRAEDWEIVRRHYTPEQRRTLEVRPGMVSPADIAWYPNLTYHDPPPPGTSAQDHYLERHMPLQLAEGLRYLERQSLFLDALVIGQTIYCMLVRSWLPPRKRPIPAVPGQDLTRATRGAHRREHRSCRSA